MQRSAIPMTGAPDKIAADIPLEVGARSFVATCVSMGNPHCVIFVEDIASVPLAELGPAIERHPMFPQRTNAHFAQVLGRREIRMRSWERGAGATLACGTGACAVCVAGAFTGRTDRLVTVHVPGGTLRIKWAASGHVFMTGPAEEVFAGTWPVRKKNRPRRHYHKGTKARI
jgi:diaminopimelate epimerase